MYRTRVGVDLAKEVIQVCIYRNNKVLSNSEMTPNEFLCWLVNTKPVTIIFEACGTSNYWKQKATNAGHDARLISVKLVSTVRQNQKTDKNDALAIVQAASLPDVTNELSAECRAAIFTEKEHLKVLIKAVHRYDDCLDKPVIADADCKKLLKLEGVGTMNAINLYIALGCAELGVFTKGKDASACIGLTPIQHSSGGG
jgi:transposase